MELAIHSSGPTRYLIVNNIDLLEFFLKLIVVFALVLNDWLHINNVLILELGITSFLSGSSISLRINLQIMQPVPEHLVIFLEDVNLLVAIVNVLQKVGVRLLTSQETLNQFLDVSYSSCSFDILKCGIDLSRISHFFLHLFSHECVPEFLDV